MKRICMLCLSVCLLFCAASSFFSVQATDLNAQTESGNTQISVHATAASRPEFSVSIPSAIQLPDLQRTANSVPVRSGFDVEVSDIQYLNGKTVSVMLSANGGAFCLYAGENMLPFRVYLGDPGDRIDDQLKNNGDVFASFSQDGSVRGYVEVDQMDIRAEGSYRGSFVFTVSSD